MSEIAKTIQTDSAPKAIGPYSQAVMMQAPQQLAFVSGQLPIDPETGKLIQGDIAAMTRRILNSIKAILEEANSSLDLVVRVDIFCTDLKDFAVINGEYANYFTGNAKPARQTVQVAALPMGAPLEISCIAMVSE